ncbi:MAG: DUF2127 domain-containing protein [Candidatus Kaiserbacteria bacterium]|nr:DUF2127 domain-containing protein [Candidatus Kaiserbacteria bacterium]
METFDTEHPTSPESMSFLFHVSMWWRIFYGFLRLILGTTLLKITGQPLSEFIFTLMSHEITGKASDSILGKLYTLFEIHDFTITYFLALYFIFWGTVDIILSLCLLHHIKRAFPIAMALIVLFILYGIFRFTYTHSLMLLTVIALDIGILYLINYEYRELRRITGDISRPSDPLLHQS